MRCLMWFRSDLRTNDNCALHHASSVATRGVVALFVVSPGQWTSHDYAAVRVDAILRSLVPLARDLARLNIPLVIRSAPTISDVPTIVSRLASDLACDALYFNKEYELDESRRDAQTTALCTKQGTRVHAMTDQTLIEPGDLRTGEGRFYTVFTPFKRAACALLDARGGIHEWPLARKQHDQVAVAPTDTTLPAAVPGFECTIPANTWPAGEAHAQQQLRDFATRSLASYKDRRDFPATPGTSMLSPALAIGTLSPRQCVRAATQANAHTRADATIHIESASPGVAQWISEILWREFYIHILVGFPRVCMHRAFQPATEQIRWNHNPEHLAAWQQGMTGVPIVDAGLRQLLRTGWMHNRVRMIVAMYFSKNLFLDWRLGERWFMRHLVDGFLASNNGGWQWSASTGTDAAPYFRVFNPVSQSAKFDPSGAYIREYVPELRSLSNDEVHSPWTLAPLLRGRLEYPEPLVDLSLSRTRAIETFAKAKGQQASASHPED
jgi:deoxyribodipyrimidine photo-lyase